MPIFLEGAVGCAKSKVPKWTNQIKVFWGRSVIETLSMRCLCRVEGGVEVPADLLLVLPLQMSGRKLVYSQGAKFLWTKSPTENSNVHVEWEWVWWLISFLSVAYWVQENLQWMDGEDWGDRELGLEGGGRSANHAGDDWHLSLQGDYGKGNLSSIAELPMLSSWWCF
jgi:hypothetical protein